MRKIGDAVEFAVCRHGLAKRRWPGDDLTGDRRPDRDPVERPAASAGGRKLLPREANGDVGFGSGGSGRDQVLLRGDALGEQALLATETSPGECGPRPRRLDLGIERRGLATLDDRQCRAARDGLAKVPRQRDEATADGG